MKDWSTNNMKKLLCVVLSVAMVLGAFGIFEAFGAFGVLSTEAFAAGTKTIDVIEIENIQIPKTDRFIVDNSYLDTEGVYIANYQWEPQEYSDKFKPFTEYTAVISLETKPRYQISNTAKVFINGQEATILSKGTDNIKVCYTFPKTGEYDVPDVYYYVNYSVYNRFYLEMGETLEIRVSQVSSVDESKMKYQWYSARSDLRGLGSPIEGANEKTYKVTATDVGDMYYYCVISYVVDGQVVNTFDSDKEMIKVSVIDKSKFYLEPVTDIDFVTYSTEEDMLRQLS